MAVEKVQPLKYCRICEFPHLKTYLKLGRTPLANAYLQKSELRKPEFSAELSLQLCPRCGLSQLTRVVPPALMFKNYLYVSSTPKTFRDHCAEMARQVSERMGLKRGELVVDIGSNDGCLLSYFKARGHRVLGIDPALNLGREARRKGIPTLSRYWNLATAQHLRRRYKSPRVLLSTNVLAHVNNAHAFVRGVAECLSSDGVWVFEVPYLLDFVRNNEFDTAYHEHLSYFAVQPLEELISSHGLSLFNVDHFPDLHGGTLRGWVSRPGQFPISRSVNLFKARETKFGLKRLAPYQAFSRRIESNRKRLLALIVQLRRQGKKIWAYGAGAKGNTLLNVFGITHEQIDHIVDDNPRKWGFYTPGSHIEISGSETLQAAQPEYLLILVWNFADEIMARCRKAGYRGAFICPVPVPKILA